MEKYILLLLFIVLIGGVSASYIYGDIYIKEGGEVVFSVNSDKEINLEGLSFNDNRITGETNELVTLENGIWYFLLDLTYYDDIVVDLHLSSNVEIINFIEGIGHFIGFDKKIISFIDQDAEFQIFMAYEKSYEKNNTIFYVIGIIGIFVLIVLFIGKLKKRKEKKFQDIFPFINDKEKAILELLMKKSMRQKEVGKKLNIPKASYSRYLVNLEKKKLILREGEGKNKILKLK